MNNRFDKKPSTEYKDAILNILLDDYAGLDVAQVLQEFEEKAEAGDLPDVPEDIDQSCRRQIRKIFACERRTQLLRKATKILVKVAVLTLMLIGLSTVTVISVEALRIPVLRFVVESFDRHSTLYIEGETEEQIHTAEEICRILDKNVPDDYKLVQRSIANDGSLCIMYTGDNSRILSLTVFASQQTIQFDTENVEYIPLLIDDYQAYFVEKNGFSIMWFDDKNQVVYELYATSLSEDCFWKIVHALIK